MPRLVARDVNKSRSCPHCQRQFRRTEHLTRHIRTHTKEKPFSCNGCGEKFGRQDLLRRHHRLVHNTVDDDENIDGDTYIDVDNSTGGGAQSQPNESPMLDERGDPTSPRHFGSPNTKIGTQRLPLPPEYCHVDFSSPHHVAGDESTSRFMHFVQSMDGEGARQLTSLLSPQNSEISTNQIMVDRDQNPFPGSLSEALHPSTTISGGASMLITPRCYENLRDALREIALVSRFKFERYLKSYQRDFGRHFPIIHFPTHDLGQAPAHLLTSMAAVGAQLLSEDINSIDLFKQAKSALRQTLAHRQGSEDDVATSMFHLLIFSIFSKDADIFEDINTIQNKLVQHVQRRPKPAVDSPELSWEAWAAAETGRRIRSATFCVVSLLSSHFGSPATYAMKDFNLLMPCQNNIWLASSREIWDEIHQISALQECKAQDVLSRLTKASQTKEEELGTSAFGFNTLLQGILQKICMIKNLQHSLEELDNPLPTETQHNLSLTLENWTQKWEHKYPNPLSSVCAREESLSTSIALLAVSHIRICFSLPSHRIFGLLNCSQMATSMTEAQDLFPTAEVMIALRHATFAMSIPIKLGFADFERSEGGLCTSIYAICLIECLLFTCKWLQSEPHDDQTEILQWLRAIAEEAATTYDCSELGASSNNPVVLSKTLVSIWAKIFENHSKFQFVNTIGIALREFTEIS